MDYFRGIEWLVEFWLEGIIIEKVVKKKSFESKKWENGGIRFCN